ncbi:MAG TPA: hypothetical protein VJL89_05940 [Thermodesulfovibrionia bacterium]|nr:hypothetical protein [Thermodesulfovibrionia bacterium]
MAEEELRKNKHFPENITEKGLEQSAQLIQAEKMSSLGIMVASVVHELMNPLMGILNFIQYCEKHTPSDSKCSTKRLICLTRSCKEGNSYRIKM